MAKRRANGEGSIRKRADGRWEGRYTVGYDPETGKQKFKNVLGKTQTEVKEKLKAAIEESKDLDISLPPSIFINQLHWIPRQPDLQRQNRKHQAEQANHQRPPAVLQPHE